MSVVGCGGRAPSGWGGLMTTGEKAVSASSRMVRRYAPFLAILVLQAVLLWLTPGSGKTTTVQAPTSDNTGEVSGGATLEQRPGAVSSGGATVSASGATGGATASGATSAAGGATTT